MLWINSQYWFTVKDKNIGDVGEELSEFLFRTFQTMFLINLLVPRVLLNSIKLEFFVLIAGEDCMFAVSNTCLNRIIEVQGIGHLFLRC